MKKNKQHILHIIYHFSTGGLENGLVNLINQLPQETFHHTVLSLIEPNHFQERLKTNNVEIITIHKKPGPLMSHFLKLYRIIKKLNPDIVHTRNLATIECQMIAWLAKVPFKIHSEHGRDAQDIEGVNPKSIFLRKSMRPFIDHYIALSKDLDNYLNDKIHIPAYKRTQIYNGVDVNHFKPAEKPAGDKLTILTAGRLNAVKDLTSLIKAFAKLLPKRSNAELVIVGQGGEFTKLEALTQQYGLKDSIRFAGQRDDVNHMMQHCDIYAQCSLFEGISNTILEAMSTGCAIVATDVGGNPELIEHQVSGMLVKPKDIDGLANTLLDLADHQSLRTSLGANARARAVSLFSLETMVAQYQKIYMLKRGVLCAA